MAKKRGDAKRRQSLTIIAWNVAGVKNKDADFWKFIKEGDVVMLLETWLEEKEWKTWEGRLPPEFKWDRVNAERLKVKGRAAGGILMGVKKAVGYEGSVQFTASKQTLKCVWKRKNVQWNLVAVYNREGWTALEGELSQQMGREEKREKEIWLVMGDFNARIGVQELVMTGDGKEIERQSMDETCNAEGKKMWKWMAEMGVVVLNGWCDGDAEGQFTYIGKDVSTVIDYGVVNECASREVESMTVGERTESGHMPLVVKIGRKEGEEKMERGRDKWFFKPYDWSIEGRKQYEERVVEQIMGIPKEGTIEERWGRIKGIIEKARVRERRKVGGERESKVRWWSEECAARKSELRRKLRELRAATNEQRDERRERYLRERRIFKSTCEANKRKWRKELEAEASKVRSEAELWKFINKERRRRVRVKNNITEEEWMQYFEAQLGGGKEGRG